MTAIDRRSLMARALVLMGAAATPAFTVEALAQAPQLLSEPRFALLSAVADTIVPRGDSVGALDANVPKLFDGLLHTWASSSRRQKLIAALDEIDAKAMTAHRKPFSELSAEQRHAVLTAHDVAAMQPIAAAGTATSATDKTAPTLVDPNYGRPKQEATVETPFNRDALVVDPAYAKLKELIVVLFYYSEPALAQELNYDPVPGEWKPSIPVTPETRAVGGVGLF
jgi:hypothetical protein